MQMINNLYRGAQNYWDEVPSNTGKQVVYAAGLAFIVETVFSNGNLQQGATAGALSALATAIYGLVTPVFKWLIGNRQLTWEEEMCRTCTAIIGAGYIAAAFGNQMILKRLFSEAILFGLMIYLKPERCDLNDTHFIAIAPPLVQPQPAT